MTDPAATVDARGQPCPRPLILTRQALATLRQGATFTVLLDNAAAAENVLRFLREIGAAPQRADEDSAIVVRATAPAAGHGPAGGGNVPGCAVPTPPAVDAGGATPRRPHVVALAGEGMGRGAEDLGRLLLQAFVNTLPGVSPVPAAVLFYNGGVKLACAGSPVLAALAALEAAGARLLVCGTCLEYYGLRPQLAAGTVSNMYDILQTLTDAGHVVAP